PPKPVEPPKPSADERLVAEAKQFVAEADAELRKLTVAQSQTEWDAETDITDAHSEVAAKANAELASAVTRPIKASNKFAPVADKLDPATRRQLMLLRYQTAAQQDPKLAQELAKVGEDMTTLYGKGVCKKVKDKEECKIVDAYSKVLEDSRKPADLLA